MTIEEAIKETEKRIEVAEKTGVKNLQDYYYLVKEALEFRASCVEIKYGGK